MSGISANTMEVELDLEPKFICSCKHVLISGDRRPDYHVDVHANIQCPKCGEYAIKCADKLEEN